MRQYCLKTIPRQTRIISELNASETLLTLARIFLFPDTEKMSIKCRKSFFLFLFPRADGVGVYYDQFSYFSMLRRYNCIIVQYIQKLRRAGGLKAPKMPTKHTKTKPRWAYICMWIPLRIEITPGAAENTPESAENTFTMCLYVRNAIRIFNAKIIQNQMPFWWILYTESIIKFLAWEIDNFNGNWWWKMLKLPEVFCW